MHGTENRTRGRRGSKQGSTENLSLQFFCVSKREAKATLREAIGEERKGNAIIKLETPSCWCLFGLSKARDEAPLTWSCSEMNSTPSSCLPPGTAHYRQDRQTDRLSMHWGRGGRRREILIISLKLIHFCSI